MKKICNSCAKEYNAKKSISKYCSVICYGKTNIGNKYTAGMKPNSTSFKKGFVPWNKNNKGLQVAWNKGKKLSKKHIENLSIAHKGKPSLNKGKKFEYKPRPKMKGRTPWNWKGGIATEQQKIRTSVDNKLWRKSIFERDNFTCQKTGISGGILNAHHINNFADFPELRLAIDNGITLSEKAHQEFHKKYGRKNNTMKQLQEFLTIRIGVRMS